MTPTIPPAPAATVRQVGATSPGVLLTAMGALHVATVLVLFGLTTEGLTAKTAVLASLFAAAGLAAAFGLALLASTLTGFLAWRRSRR